MRATLSLAFAGCALAHSPHDVIAGLWANPKGDVALTISRGLMLRSHDGGMNWARSHNGLPPFTVEIPKYMDATLAQDEAPFHKSIFLLDTFWPSPVEDYQGMAMYRSDDTGHTWTQVASPSLLEASSSKPSINGYRDLPTGSRLALAANTPAGSTSATILVGAKQMLRSTDSGKTFVPVGPKKLADVTSVLTDGQTGLNFAGTLTGDIFVSADDGATWKPLKQDVLKMVTHMAVIPKSTENNNLYAIGPDGLIMLAVTKEGELTDSMTLLSKEEIDMPEKDLYESAPLVAATKTSIFVTVDDRQWARKRDESAKWVMTKNGKGLHSNIDLATRTSFPSYNYMFATTGEGRLFSAGFTGVYRSDDAGDAWIKLDTLLPLLSGITMSDADENGHAGVAVCAYAAGCFHGMVDMSKPTPQVVGKMDRLYVPISHLNKPGKKLPEFPEIGSHTARYVMIGYSPTFAKSGVVLAASQQAGLQRSSNGGKSWTEVALPIQIQSDHDIEDDQDFNPTVHTIAFSPDFESDNTAYISGWNLDIAVSKDGGKSFQGLWKAGGTHKFISYCRLTLSPFFGAGPKKDQTLLAILRNDDHAPYEGKLAVDHRKDYKSHCMAGAFLHLSTNGGKDWEKVSQFEPILDAMLLEDGSVLATLGQCSAKRRSEQPDFDKWNPETGHVSGDATVPVAQLMIMRPPLSASKRFEQVKGAGLEAGGVRQRVGGQTLATLPDGVLAFGWESGGMTYGKIGPEGLIERVDVGVPGSPRTIETPWLQQILPGEGSIRGKQNLLVTNKQGHLAGASGFSVTMSKDGKQWHDVFSLPHTVTESENMLPGCAKMRNSADGFKDDVQSTADNGFADSGIYCLECKTGVKRNFDGSCGENGLALFPKMVASKEELLESAKYSDHAMGEYVLAKPRLQKAPSRSALNLLALGDEAAGGTATGAATGAAPFVMLLIGLSAGLAMSAMAIVGATVVRRVQKRLEYAPVA